MDSLRDLSSSSLPVGLSPGISNTESADHGVIGSDQDSFRQHPGSLGSISSSDSTRGSAPDSLDTDSLPRALIDGSAPTSSSGASALSPMAANKHDASPGKLSALHIAPQESHRRIMRVLLQHGIDCNEMDSDGLTPLAPERLGCGWEFWTPPKVLDLV